MDSLKKKIQTKTRKCFENKCVKVHDAIFNGNACNVWFTHDDDVGSVYVIDAGAWCKSADNDEYNLARLRFAAEKPTTKTCTQRIIREAGMR